MSLPLSVKALSATGAFLMICVALRAGSPNDLVTEGDAFDVRLEAAEALQFYLPAKKLQPSDVACWCLSRGNIVS
jgi:hypothetical protein